MLKIYFNESKPHTFLDVHFLTKKAAFMKDDVGTRLPFLYLTKKVLQTQLFLLDCVRPCCTCGKWGYVFDRDKPNEKPTALPGHHIAEEKRYLNINTKESKKRRKLYSKADKRHRTQFNQRLVCYNQQSRVHEKRTYIKLRTELGRAKQKAKRGLDRTKKIFDFTKRNSDETTASFMQETLNYIGKDLFDICNLRLNSKYFV